MKVTGYAYAWDVLSQGFADRVRELGVDEVAVALSYHSARAAPATSTRTGRPTVCGRRRWPACCRAAPATPARPPGPGAIRTTCGPGWPPKSAASSRPAT